MQHKHRSHNVAGAFCSAGISLHVFAVASNRVVIMSILTHCKQTSVGILCERLFVLDTPSVVLLLVFEVSLFFCSIDKAYLSARVRNQSPG